MFQNVHKLFCAVLLAAILMPLSVRGQDRTDALLFHALHGGGSGRLPSMDALAVDIDLDALSLLRDGDPAELLSPAGEVLFGVVTRVERRTGTCRSVFGTFPEDPDSFFVLVREDDAVVGAIELPTRDQRLSLRVLPGGLQYVAAIEPPGIPDCGTQDQGVLPPNATTEDPQEWTEDDDGGDASGRSCAFPGRHFDVMIYYTPAARDEAGGTNAINAECQLAVDTANQTYVDSQIAPRVVLVYRGLINYTESGSLETDRDRLRDYEDGYMDDVPFERELYGADFVSLFVENASADWCGYAFCTPDDRNEGFCVVSRFCASTRFSFAHELGHLQGCAHNVEDAGSGCNEYCDSYGHRFTGDTGTKWRTVMSYDTNPSAYTRIGRWSNPNVLFDGQPCGVTTPECDDDRWNSATINATARDREYWFGPRFDVWVEADATFPYTGAFEDPFPTVDWGILAVFDGASPLVQPTLTLKAGVYPEVLTINKPMTILACGGVARIGGAE